MQDIRINAANAGWEKHSATQHHHITIKVGWVERRETQHQQKPYNG
jgi:hypothetical protein